MSERQPGMMTWTGGSVPDLLHKDARASWLAWYWQTGTHWGFTIGVYEINGGYGQYAPSGANYADRNAARSAARREVKRLRRERERPDAT